MFLGGYVPCNCDLRCVPITTMLTATEPTTGMSLLYLFLYLICSEMIVLLMHPMQQLRLLPPPYWTSPVHC